MYSCSAVSYVSLLRNEGRSSGLDVQPQVIKLMRVSLLGMSWGRLSKLVSGRIPRSTLNMICMGFVTSDHKHMQTLVYPGSAMTTHSKSGYPDSDKANCGIKTVYILV